MTNSNKKRYTQTSDEQKLYAVQEVLINGRTRKDVADELNVHVNSVIKWIAKSKEGKGDPKRTPSTPCNQIEELNRLREIERKYNEQLQEIEILKKFQAFLKEKETANDTKPYRP